MNANKPQGTIDIIEIIENLIKEKVIVIFSIILSLIAAYIFLSYNSEKKIYNVPIIESTSMKQDLVRISLMESYINYELPKKNEDIWNLFKNLYENTNILEINYNNANNIKEITAEDRDKIKKKYELKSYNDDEYFLITLKTADIDKDINVLTKTFEDINKLISRELISITSLVISNNKKILYETLADFKIKLESTKINYQIDTAARLKYLKEQYQLAKELDFSNLSKDILIKDTFNNLFDDVSEVSPGYYFKGHETIKAEIDVIEGRSGDIELYDSYYREILKDRNNYKGLNEIKIENYELTLEDFKNSLSNSFYIISEDQIVSPKNNRDAIYYMLFSALALFLSTLYIIVRKSIRDYRKKIG